MEEFIPIKNLHHMNLIMDKLGIEHRVYPGTPLTKEQQESRLFHYTKLDTFLKYIWPDRRLRSGEIQNLNDLFERSKRISSASPQQIALMYAFEIIRKQYRQISFTMDFDSFKEGCMSSLMWAYYAESTNGVCIEFDPSKLNLSVDDMFGSIKYERNPSREITIPAHVKSINAIESIIRDNKDEIFFTKPDDWIKENEYRIVTKREFTYFDYDAINCIYVTSYDSETCIKVEDATDGIVPVKFLHLDNNSLPLVSDTRSYREQMERAASNPNNALNLIMREAEDIYEKFKSFPDADMTTNIFDILSI